MLEGKFTFNDSVVRGGFAAALGLARVLVAAAPEKPKARRHLHHGGYHWRTWRTWRHRRRGHEDTGEPKGGGATAADY